MEPLKAPFQMCPVKEDRPMNRSSDSTLFGSAIIRRLGVLALVGGTCLVGGCLSDSELNDQKSAQTEIEAASTRYATLISEVGVEKTPLIIADGLEKVVREVKSIKGTSTWVSWSPDFAFKQYLVPLLQTTGRAHAEYEGEFHF